MYFTSGTGSDLLCVRATSDARPCAKLSPESRTRKSQIHLDGNGVNQDLGDKFRIADDTPRTSSVASRDSVLLTALPPLQVAE
jgi:hypothetical protein